MALLEDEEYQQQVIQAEADLGVAKANLEEAMSAQELAQKEYDRAKTLHQKGILSDAELEAAQSAFATRDARFKVTRAQIANQQAALETAKVRLSYTRIRAAWETGGDVRFVGERFVNPGAMLSSNTPILSVIELQPITAVIHVTEKDYFRLKPEQPVILTSGAYPGAGVPRAAWPGSRPSSRRPRARPGSRSTSTTPTAPSSPACSSTPGSSSPTARTRPSSRPAPSSTAARSRDCSWPISRPRRPSSSRRPWASSRATGPRSSSRPRSRATSSPSATTCSRTGRPIILPADAPGAAAPPAKPAPGDKR